MPCCAGQAVPQSQDNTGSQRVGRDIYRACARRSPHGLVIVAPECAGRNENKLLVFSVYGGDGSDSSDGGGCARYIIHHDVRGGLELAASNRLAAVGAPGVAAPSRSGEASRDAVKVLPEAMKADIEGVDRKLAAQKAK